MEFYVYMLYAVLAVGVFIAGLVLFERLLWRACRWLDRCLRED